jgi:aspartate/methionine/tyrosine aminotransferase
MNWNARAAILFTSEIGEPDFDTPAPIVRAGIDWLKKGRRITHR